MGCFNAAVKLFDQPILKALYEQGNKTYYRVEEDYSYYFRTPNGYFKLVIEAGAVTDLASVPRWAWSLTGIERSGLINAAALVHDQLYKWRGLVPNGKLKLYKLDRIPAMYASDWRSVTKAMTRLEADAMFREMLEESKAMDAFRRQLAYLGVRIGGRLYW